MVGDLYLRAVRFTVNCNSFNERVYDMKTFEFEGKKHEFAEDIVPKPGGLYTATLTDHNNVRCEMWFVNGELKRLVELD